MAIVSKPLGKRLINGPNGPNGPSLKLYEVLCPNCPNTEQSWGITHVEASMDIECKKCGTDLTPEGVTNCERRVFRLEERGIGPVKSLYSYTHCSRKAGNSGYCWQHKPKEKV